MIHVSVGNHRLQSFFRVTCRKLIFHMLVPTIRHQLLRVRESFAGEMTNEKLERAEMRKLGGLSIVMLAARSSESMILFGIFVNCSQGIRIKHCMNLSLSFGRTIFVATSNVQHERRR